MGLYAANVALMTESASDQHTQGDKAWQSRSALLAY